MKFTFLVVYLTAGGPALRSFLPLSVPLSYCKYAQVKTKWVTFYKQDFSVIIIAVIIFYMQFL